MEWVCRIGTAFLSGGSERRPRSRLGHGVWRWCPSTGEIEAAHEAPALQTMPPSALLLGSVPFSGESWHRAPRARESVFCRHRRPDPLAISRGGSLLVGRGRQYGGALTSAQRFGRALTVERLRRLPASVGVLPTSPPSLVPAPLPRRKTSSRRSAGAPSSMRWRGTTRRSLPTGRRGRARLLPSLAGPNGESRHGLDELGRGGSRTIPARRCPRQPPRFPPPASWPTPSKLSDAPRVL